MTIPNVSDAPPIWSDAQLKIEAQRALDDFVDRRLAETSNAYVAHVGRHKRAIFELFGILQSVDPFDPDPEIVRKILLDEGMFNALRYMAGPPVSSDDLGVLVSRDVKGINKTLIRKSDDLVKDVLRLICKLADPVRLPWIGNGRAPTRRELRDSVASTAVLHATQSLQTERRGFGKIVERKLESRLIALGFHRAVAPAKGRVTAPAHHPNYPGFYGECTVYGRKVDLLIPLKNGRIIALEAKDSSSALNSVKRLNNDTAAKARHYAVEGGRNILSVALLSGVFKFENLQRAQESGLFLVWSHDMDGFIDWIRSQD
jgi:XamI restriction endonuclease